MIHLIFKGWRDRWKSLSAWAAVVVFMAAIQLSVYPSIAKSSADVEQFLKAFPEAFQKIFRMEDYTSGAGFLSAELFSMILPLVLIALGAAWGASASAEEEEKGTADLLFSMPWTRRRIMMAKIAAALSVLIFFGVIIVATIAIGMGLVDMELSLSNLIAGALSTVLLGAVFTGFALLIGAWTGRKGVANGAAAGIAILTFIFYSLSGLVDSFDFLAPINPFEWAVGTNPLADGWNVMALLKLAALAASLIVASIAVVERKDLAI